MQSGVVETQFGTRFNPRLLSEPDTSVEVPEFNAGRETNRTFLSRTVSSVVA